MQKLQFALFQIDEAKRYFIDGSLPALRTALILLDNAAELILDRWIKYDLARDILLQKMQRLHLAMRIPEDKSDLSDLLQRNFLTYHEIRQVARFFDEKVRYVTEVKGKLPSSVGAVLSHLHRYRNQAYHSGRVRVETLRSFVIIYLELCCKLVTLLIPGASSYSSNEDYSWLERRFKLKPSDLWSQEILATVLDVFREGLPTTGLSFLQTLAENLESRFIDVYEALDFIAETTFIKLDRATALTEAQKYALQDLKERPPYESIPKGLDKPVSLEDLKRLDTVPDVLRNSSDPLRGFEVYADADIKLERIEFLVYRLAGAIDEAIQLKIDEMRGK